ncbi:hypothetical protein G3O08_02125 [Cryomorpha ignava]|uniref:DUF86 domain-containing protein n=1 Tax=Cryomorpha ignava TaxID=101383 RepID=A0A7K3WKX8_9FLAO|nr:hypothetical protein [Cryomorpha ignava]NEN22300.1 hypothetical protein [Cryomorpha ignava]
MKDLIQTIDGIAKYGLYPDLEIENKEIDLEFNLIRLYSLSFQITNEIEKVHEK